MNKQTDEEILETLKGWHALSAQPYKTPTMTDRDRLAEKLFIEHVFHSSLPSTLTAANWAIDTADVFFAALEGDTDE